MKHLIHAHPSRWRLATWLVSLIVLLLSFFQFIPVFIALRAGIAGLGLIIFTPLLLAAGFMAYVAWQQKLIRTTLLASTSALVAFLSLTGPLVNYLAIANKEAIGLTFQPLHYVKFTGDSIVPARTNVYKEVDGQQLRFAIYNEDVSTVKPTVILVHGGGWQHGDYLRTNNWPKLLRDAGYQVISVEYRLASPDHPTWNKAPKDIRDAVAFIKTYAPKLGIKSDQIALMGQSAGGHLALLEANSSHSVRAVVGLYSPTDLETDYRLSIDKDSELAFLGGTPNDHPDRYKSVSVPLVLSEKSPSTLLIQGTNDDLVDPSSSKQLGRLLEYHNVKSHVILLPYTGHSFDNQVGGFATQIAEQAVLDFLAETLR